MNQKNKYGLDKNNPVAIKIWHYYNGVQKIEFDKMIEDGQRKLHFLKPLKVL